MSEAVPVGRIMKTNIIAERAVVEDWHSVGCR